MSVNEEEVYLERGGSKRERHPVTGIPVPGVCVDVIPLGDRVEQFGTQAKKVVPKVVFVYQTGQVDSEGRLFEIAKEFTLSDGDKASLPKFLSAWRGTEITKDEVKAKLPLSSFKGRPALLSLITKVSGAGNERTDIGAIMPTFPGVPTPALPPYTRAPFWAERKAEYAAGVAQYKTELAAGARLAPPAVVAQPTIAPPVAAQHVDPQDAALQRAIAAEVQEQNTLPVAGADPVPF